MIKSKILSVALIITTLLTMVGAVSVSADDETTTTTTWDFASYVKTNYSTDTPISNSRYDKLPDLEFAQYSEKPNCWNTYKNWYGIALYERGDGNYIKYTPLQSGTLSLTAFYKAIDTNQRWLSVDTAQPATSFNKLFDLQTDTAENKVTTPQTRTIDLTAGNTYYIHGDNIILTKLVYVGSGEKIEPPKEPLVIDSAETDGTKVSYSVTVNYAEKEYDLYTAIYRNDGTLYTATKNQVAGEFDAEENVDYTVKAMLWEKGTMIPITAVEKEVKNTVLKDKTVYAFGDSIVYGHTQPATAFMNLIALDNDMTLTKCAVNGATVVVDGNNDIITQLGKAPNDSPDFIVFDGYTNDAYGSTDTTSEYYDTLNDGSQPDITTRIGTAQGPAATTFDNTTFCGAFEEILYTMKQKWPTAKIVYVTIHKSGGRDFKIQSLLREKTIEMCDEWGVTVADVFNDTTLDTRDSAQMSKYIIGGKGSHPNLAGCWEFYVPLVTNTLRSLCK